MYGIKTKLDAEKRITFRTSSEKVEKYKEIAEKHNWVLSDMIRHSLELFVENLPKSQKPSQTDFGFPRNT